MPEWLTTTTNRCSQISVVTIRPLLSHRVQKLDPIKIHVRVYLIVKRRFRRDRTYCRISRRIPVFRSERLCQIYDIARRRATDASLKVNGWVNLRQDERQLEAYTRATRIITWGVGVATISDVRRGLSGQNSRACKCISRTKL